MYDCLELLSQMEALSMRGCEERRRQQVLNTSIDIAIAAVLA